MPLHANCNCSSSNRLRQHPDSMRISPEQLASTLGKTLLPCYFVSSDEILLLQETADSIRAAAREQGFSERVRFNADRSFNWGQLYEAAASMSLFADKRIIELHLPTGKPGDQGAKALQEYLQQANGDNLLLLTSPKLDGSTLRTKWVKELQDSKHCGFIQIAEITVAQLPAWLQQRLARLDMSADDDSLAFLAEHVEGNLLAAAQEIEKLALLTTSKKLDLATVQQAIANSSRYDVFALADAALTGDKARSMRILAGLRGEGQAVPSIAWIIAREVRELSRMGFLLGQGQSLQQVTSRVWPAARKPLVSQALKRQRPEHWHGLLQLAQLIDEQGKGQSPGDPWLSLEQLLLQF